jgi:peptidoglycan hydrolase-like protein with peptidoglycan-binding domain
VEKGAHVAEPDAPEPVAADPQAAPAFPAAGAASREGVLFVQRHAGNAAAGRLLRATRVLARKVVPEGSPGKRTDTDVGDTGPGVKLLQRMLGVAETGTFDQATRTALDRFQKMQGWDPSGVGPLTWAALDNHEGTPGNRPNLVEGDRGPAVKLLQRLLGVQQTSFFGTGTRAAVDQFQRQMGWEPSGVGPMTWERLDGHAGAPGKRPNLNLGDRGPGVKLLQHILGVAETSIFDAATRTAVDAFQKKQGWDPSGVGPMTWAALDKERPRIEVADRMAAMANPASPTRAVWHPSGNDPDSTDFSAWALAAAEDTSFSVSPTTVINCWEMVLYSAWKQGAISWSWINTVYSWTGGHSWYEELAIRLVRGSASTWDRATKKPRPQRGDIVMFDGADHVALATGVTDAAGTHVYSFWPPPDTAFAPVDYDKPGKGKGIAGGTPDRVKDTTIEALINAMDTSSHTTVVTLGPPAW